jgi:hypothetical protein
MSLKFIVFFTYIKCEGLQMGSFAAHLVSDGLGGRLLTCLKICKGFVFVCLKNINMAANWMFEFICLCSKWITMIQSDFLVMEHFIVYTCWKPSVLSLVAAAQFIQFLPPPNSSHSLSLLVKRLESDGLFEEKRIVRRCRAGFFSLEWMQHAPYLGCGKLKTSFTMSRV